jgi:hypothetical protein
MAQPREAAPARAAEDPQLRRMLATHIHCGEAMQLVAADRTSSIELPDGKNDGGLLTYRCACGFSFDQRQD